MKNVIIIDGVSYTRTDLIATLKNADDKTVQSTKTREEHFWRLFNSGVQKEDKEKYPDSLFSFTKNGGVLWEYDRKKKIVWLRWLLIWSFFEKEYGIEYQQIQVFTKGLLEEHFKTKGLTTDAIDFKVIERLEEHFKTKGLTTVGCVTPDEV